METLPDHYSMIYRFDVAELIQKKVKWWAMILAFLGGILLGVILGWVMSKMSTPILKSTTGLGLLLTILLIFIVHEGIHGSAFVLFGGKPRFGVKLIGGWKYILVGLVLYATADGYYSRQQYAIIGLSPLVVVTLGGLIIALVTALQSYALWAVIANAMGSIGDIMMITRLRKFPNSVLVRDTEDGYEVYATT